MNVVGEAEAVEEWHEIVQTLVGCVAVGMDDYTFFVVDGWFAEAEELNPVGGFYGRIDEMVVHGQLTGQVDNFVGGGWIAGRDDDHFHIYHLFIYDLQLGCVVDDVWEGVDWLVEDDDALGAFSFTNDFGIVGDGGKLKLPECAEAGSGGEAVAAPFGLLAEWTGIHFTSFYLLVHNRRLD